MTKRPNLLLLPLLTMSLALTACGNTESDIPPPGVLAKSDLERDLSPTVSPADAQDLVRGNTEFALQAYHQLIQPGENLFYSPLSVSMAMAMTYGGARTNTESQMADALYFTLPQDRLHPAFDWLDLELAGRGAGAQGADGKAFRLNITNATFGQIDYEFLPAYLDLLAQNYGAGMSLLDFMADPDGSRRQINEWVSARTEGKIDELLPMGSIQDMTKLVLVNAVYFNAAWKSPFNPESTSDRVFHAPGGDITVPTMNGGHESMPYTEGSGYQAVSLPYEGDEIDMVIILPEPGMFAEVEASLDVTRLDDIFASLGPSAYGLVSLPRFEFGYKASMVEPLQSLGLIDAFDENADFSGMDGTRRLQITGIQHQAYVKVNEAGTEAAAATGVVAGTTSIPQELAIDRPFMFAIRDIATGSVLFFGRVLDPTAK